MARLLCTHIAPCGCLIFSLGGSPFVLCLSTCRNHSPGTLGDVSNQIRSGFMQVCSVTELHCQSCSMGPSPHATHIFSLRSTAAGPVLSLFLHVPTALAPARPPIRPWLPPLGRRCSAEATSEPGSQDDKGAENLVSREGGQTIYSDHQTTVTPGQHAALQVPQLCSAPNHHRRACTHPSIQYVEPV